MRELYFISPRLTKKEYKAGSTFDVEEIYYNMSNAMRDRITNNMRSDYMIDYSRLTKLLPYQVTFVGLCDGFTNTKAKVYMYKILIDSDDVSAYHGQKKLITSMLGKNETYEKYEEKFKKMENEEKEKSRKRKQKSIDIDKKKFDERVKKLGIDPTIEFTSRQIYDINRMHPNDRRSDEDKFRISKIDPKHWLYDISINKALHTMVDRGFADNIDDIDYKLYQAYDNQVRYGYAFDGIHGIANATKTDENGMMEKKPFIHILELAGRTKKNEALKTYLRAARNRIRMIKKGYKPVINKGMKTPVRKKYDNPWSENY